MKNEDAVSPVVGVMLMLVVTIIIAAVVSGFAGGLTDSTESTPAVTMDVNIVNSGRFATSSFLASITSVSEPIQTKDLRLTTSWSASNRSYDKNLGGDETITRVTTVTSAANVFGWSPCGGFPSSVVAPWGYGAGIDSINSGAPSNDDQQFGNYVLIAGTTMKAYPAGQGGGYVSYSVSDDGGYGIDDPYEYSSEWVYDAGNEVDGMQAVLGKGWENLRSGDVVTVTMTYTPSGRNIFEKDVVVEES